MKCLSLVVTKCDNFRKQQLDSVTYQQGQGVVFVQFTQSLNLCFM